MKEEIQAIMITVHGIPDWEGYYSGSDPILRDAAIENILNLFTERIQTVFDKLRVPIEAEEFRLALLKEIKT